MADTISSHLNVVSEPSGDFDPSTLQLTVRRNESNYEKEETDPWLKVDYSGFPTRSHVMISPLDLSGRNQNQRREESGSIGVPRNSQICTHRPAAVLQYCYCLPNFRSWWTGA